jgi:hypothetical protein
MSELTTTQDNLFAGDFPVATDSVTLVSGAGALTRGTVLGKVTASQKFKQCNPAASTGEEEPRAILAEATDATSADAIAPVYLTGQFNVDALGISGATFSAATLNKMTDRSIFTRAVGERS